mmetsp:Transcript_38883/g.93306  ORF Transcript_38883/g.93306 Transcript_38883/m.93306 type:complete len:240 (+) Transcript_38883:472-1191(+)
MVAARFDKVEIDLWVQEHLRDHKLCPCVHLFFQVYHLLLKVGIAADGDDLRTRLIIHNPCPPSLCRCEGRPATFHNFNVVWMALWITSDGDGEVVTIAGPHVLHKVERTRKTTLCCCPRLLPPRWIAPERHNVAHTNLFASIEGFSAHFALLIGASEMHVCYTAKLVFRCRGELQRELRCGTARAPSKVSEERPQGLHPHDALLQVGDTLCGLWWEVFKGEPAGRCLGSRHLGWRVLLQ